MEFPQFERSGRWNILENPLDIFNYPNIFMAIIEVCMANVHRAKAPTEGLVGEAPVFRAMNLLERSVKSIASSDW